MNAPTAQPDPGTQKTSATATATTADSTTMLRIDSFIKSKLTEANGADASGIIDSSNRAAALGFANAANLRYSKFLEAFRSSPQLTERYKEKYPNSLFLPWPALHAVIKALDLWVDLPENYMGAVPAEQLPWMEIFELEDEDRIRSNQRDVGGLLPWSNGGRIADLINFRPRSPESDVLQSYWEQAGTSFFVVAPAEAFQTKEDWLSRFRKLAEKVSTEPTVAPDDPLVIRFCFGGCLVVAAWGDEAQALNEITKELKL